jgi:hypothetical protein
MKIHLLNPKAFCELTGVPPVESFTLTAKQLGAWNAVQFRTFGISANENVNAERGLPCAVARRWLRSLHSAKFGICNPSGRLTWADVKNAME